jgi:hypothetical protein
MKKLSLSAVIVTGLMLMSGSAIAQATSSGTLAVQAELAGTINLTFVSDGSGVPLGGTGTNAASLDFGTVSQFGNISANVSRVLGSGFMTLSTPFDVLVTKSNDASATYALSAQLTTAPGVNGWTIDTFPLNATTPTSLTVTGAYSSAMAHSLILNIPNTEVAGTISNVVNFVAIAN